MVIPHGGLKKICEIIYNQIVKASPTVDPVPRAIPQPSDFIITPPFFYRVVEEFGIAIPVFIPKYLRSLFPEDVVLFNKSGAASLGHIKLHETLFISSSASPLHPLFPVINLWLKIFV